MLRKALLYLRTVRRMKPVMVASRLRRVRSVEGSLKGETGSRSLMISISDLDCAPGYLRRFDLDALSGNEFLLLNERYTVDLSKWVCPNASHLWNFNLHYFEYCIPLAVRYAACGSRRDYEHFKTLVVSWIASCEYPNGDAWHPYTISLRLVNWLICIDLFGEVVDEDRGFKAMLDASMALQYRHLLANQETHLLANHYWENLKTLLVMALYFGDHDALQKIENDFLRQLNEQILPDGVHCERSMMYHKLVLEGLLRVVRAYRSVDRPIPVVFVEKAKLMLDAMASLERGMGKTPFFNDAADGVAKECDQLVAACGSVLGLEADGSKAAFPDAGYYKLYGDGGRIAVMVDAGMPGPPYMLGHAHCDCLSYELSVDGKPVVTNCGTYAYQSELRSWFRSTAAHSTMKVGNHEQMECWGEHRVARGIRRVYVDEFSDRGIEAWFEDCRGTRCRRRLKVSQKSVLVEDSAASGEPLVSFVCLAPGFEASVENDAVICRGSDASLRFECEASPQIDRVDSSSEFGRLEKAYRLAFAGSESSSVSYRIALDC